MEQEIDAIFAQGVFRPLEPCSLPDGTRVHLRVDREPLLKDSNGKKIQSIEQLKSDELADAFDGFDDELEQWRNERWRVDGMFEGSTETE